MEKPAHEPAFVLGAGTKRMLPRLGVGGFPLRWMSQVPYFRIAAAAAACWLMQVATCQAAPEDVAKTIACFNAGNQTVQSMYACSGYWVTPRALMFCLFQSECPILGDTVANRATLDASLGRDRRNTQLTLDPANLPKFPSASQIEDCNNKEHNAGAFRDCVLNAMAMAPPGLLQCASIRDDRVRAGCLIAIANDPEITPAARCIHHIVGAQAFLSCLNNPDFARAVQTAASCLNTPNQHPADCLDPEASPADAALIDCLSSSGMTGMLAAKCLDNESPDLSKVHQTTTCLQKPTSDPLKCAFILASGTTAKVIDCLSNIADPQARTACVLSSIPEFAALGPARACAGHNLKGARLSDCVAPFLGDDTVKFVTCMSYFATARLDRCLSSLSSNIAEAMRDQACLLKTLGTLKLLACVSAKLGGEAPRIVACFLGDQGRVLPCLVGGRPDYSASEQVYACVDGGRDAGAVIENCAGGLIADEKTRRVASCLAESWGDKAQWAACAGLAALPANTARYVSCAADNQGATSFALCSLGATMNEEWRIAAACAVQAYGDPSAYAGCIGGRLTVQELANCFGGKVGRDCYGPDDVVVHGLHDALRGVLDTPGKNGFIAAAVNKIGQLAGGPSSVVNKGQISAGKNSIFHNPGKGVGNDNSIFHNPRQIAQLPAPRKSVVYQVTHAKLP
jgi:hypothetical protein